MKKFILFLFLLTSVSLQSAYAQDLGDEFTDPSLNTSTNENSMPLSQGFEPSTNQQAPEGKPLALDEPELDPSRGGDVVVEQQTNLYQSYRQRRGHHGVLFSVNYEKFYPSDYYSMYRDKYIDEFLGDSESIDLLGAEIGYKYNFKLGSVAILGNYAHGSKANSTYNADGVGVRERNLTLSRYGLSLNYAADNLMEEPWVVPYGQVGIHQFQVTEDDLAKPDNKSITTQISFNYKFGLLFQLNWIERAIDPSTQVDGLKSSGLQNTFIDIFAMTHMASTKAYSAADNNSDGDPDLSTGMEFGVGLKLEF